MTGTASGAVVALTTLEAATVTASGVTNASNSFSLASVSNSIPFHAVDNSVTTSTTGSIVVARTEPRYMMHSYFGEKPTLTVYDKSTAVKSGVDITYQANNNILVAANW